MKTKLVLIFLIFYSAIGFSQMVKVYEKSGKHGVSNVFIYNTQKTKSALTNSEGKVDLSIFDISDTLCFQHISYQLTKITMKKAKSNGYIIYLKDKTMTFEPWEIIGSKLGEERSEVANKIKTIDNKSIKLFNPQTTADVLASSNEVFVQKSQLGGGSPMIRGFSANSVLIVVDGVRINNAIFRSGNLQNVISIDPNTIETAEVIYGPGSVIYGSDALGGVMFFRTTNPKLSQTNKAKFSMNVLSRISTANNEKTAHADYNLGFKKFAFYGSYTQSDFGDLMSGKNFNPDYPDFGKRPEFVDTYNGVDKIIQNENQSEQRQSAYDQTNITQKIRFKPNSKLDFNYSFHYSTTSNIPRYDRLVQYKDSLLKYAKWYYGPQKWIMNSLNIYYKDSTLLFDEIKFIAAYQDVEESRHDRKFQSSKLTSRTEKVKVFSINLDFEKMINKNNFLFYGIETAYNDVNSSGQIYDSQTSQTYATSSRYPDGGTSYQSYAAYTSLKTLLTKKLSLISGIRYTQILLNSKFNTNPYSFPFNELDINTGALNGSIGLLVKQNEKLFYSINASSGFRAPNLDDVGKVFDSEPGSVIVPNANLKPEYAYNIDFNINKKFFNSLEIELSAFYTYLKDAMVRRDFQFNNQDSIMYDDELSKVSAIVNAGKANIYGLSGGIIYDISDYIKISTHLTWMEGEDDEGFPIRHVTPLFGNTSITYKQGISQLSIYANYNGWKHFDEMPPSELSKTDMYTVDGSPSWYTLNIKSTFDLSANISLNLGIENILDLHYRTYSSGISAPGRNFVAALRASF
ncbi:MAG: TonB-dependent receptor [Saprospiraceae bacterium]|nr:TonB-dependent receptor [Saprospiraceae bacterium]